jgi:Fic family protein
MASELPLSLRLIRDTHRVLLRDVREHKHTPGEFRRGQVYIGHDKRFIPPPANELDDWNEWLEFCIDGTIVQAQDTVRRCQKLLDLKDVYQSRLLKTKGSVRLSQLVEDLFAAPFTQIPRVKRRFETSYPTAKSNVETLVRAGILRQVPDISPRTFLAHEIFAIAFDEPTG